MITRLLKLQERGRSLINSGRTALDAITTDMGLRNEIDALYRYYYGKTVTGCSNCYADALIKLCTLTKDEAMNKSENFVMRRGKVLKDVVNRDARLNMVRGNETDELALYHLYTNPRAVEAFERLPEAAALKEMAAEYGKKYEAERAAKNGVDGTGSTEADKLLSDASEALAKANEDAAHILADANKVNEDAIQNLEDAKAEAEKIVADAKAEATKIIETAKTEAAETVKTAKAPKVSKSGGNPDPIME